jgi:hypothetical protein
MVLLGLMIRTRLEVHVGKKTRGGVVRGQFWLLATLCCSYGSALRGAQHKVLVVYFGSFLAVLDGIERPLS